MTRRRPAIHLWTQQVVGNWWLAHLQLGRWTITGRSRWRALACTKAVWNHALHIATFRRSGRLWWRLRWN